MEIDTQRKRTTQRRRDILDASLRCFMRHGIEAATIEQIREASGASSGSIYHHFGSKQAIALALYVEGMEELASVFRTAMDQQSDLQLGLERILKSYFRWVADHREWALYLLRVATADVSTHEGAAIDDINRRTRFDLGNWLRPFVERGDVARLPDELYASLVFGAATHYARHWLVGRLTLDLELVSEHLSAATCRALGGSQVARICQTVQTPKSRSKPKSSSPIAVKGRKGSNR